MKFKKTYFFLKKILKKFRKKLIKKVEILKSFKKIIKI